MRCHYSLTSSQTNSPTWVSAPNSEYQFANFKQAITSHDIPASYLTSFNIGATNVSGNTYLHIQFQARNDGGDNRGGFFGGFVEVTAFSK